EVATSRALTVLVPLAMRGNEGRRLFMSLPKARHDRMDESVEMMLKLHKDLPKAKTPHEQESLQRQIAATDKAIDALVYELYGLTEEEIKVVEGDS
ncbi:MAG: hypothetical protein NTX53_12035, partial [candidate division WOR-3 bacterium]|nr:hypothetical protein [candidate division WOR-3 bacterium]